MFRNWRRRRRREQALAALAPRLAELAAELGTALGREVQLDAAGSRGRDSIFAVRDAAGIWAMLRVLNPHLARKPLAADMPFRVPPGADRLAREWQCYRRASAAGLAPRPLWRAPDAIACTYVHGQRLMDALAADTRAFWTLNARASAALVELHAAGVTHMDASLANVIDARGALHFIDFEYAPAPSLLPEQMFAYDHLRLVESGIKFAPDDVVPACDAWLDVLRAGLTDAVRSADLAPLAPALPRTLAHAALHQRLATCFRGLPP